LQPFLSIIIPALNEESRLPTSLESILTFLGSQSFEAEVLVVDNGSQDGTLAIARSYAARHPALRVVQEPRRGKGAAVRCGMLAARGAYRFIADADLSMPIDQVLRFLPPQLPNVDIAIASREAPGAVRYGEPPYRHLIGRGFNLLVRWIAVPGFQDTQCGFKAFRDQAAIDLFQSQRLDGWTFDVEVLFIGLRRGYRIVEVPIPWTHNPGSRVRVLRDSIAMLRDLFRIRRLWLQGAYEPAARVEPTA
jgi:glycosyltransferase involved in cell wall biosynthesis